MDDNTFWAIIVVTCAGYYTIKHLIYYVQGRRDF